MIAYTFYLQTEYQLRDFERALGLREVAACLQKAGVPPDVTLHISPNLYEAIGQYGEPAAVFPYAIQIVEEMPIAQICVFTLVRIGKTLVRELAYIERVEGISAETPSTIIPTQVYINRLPKMVKSGSDAALPEIGTLETVRCNKREHSYLSHSFHAYKGKYYPQLVGALLNMCGVQPGDWVLEPFAGSGTTLVECAMRGVNAVGIDMNPLARLIAEVKTSAVTEPFSLIEANCRHILATLKNSVSTCQWQEAGLDQFLPENRAYLREWFPPDALAEINACLRAIRKYRYAPSQGICLLALSDNLREISLQDPESLRVLRRKTPPPPANLLERMTRGVEKRLNALETQRCLAPYCHPTAACAHVLKGDARHIGQALQEAALGNIRFKAAITSPPYATALPYIDTDRLSLFALGLLQKGERGELEWAMIGNREISDAKRRELETQLMANEHGLPTGVLAHIRNIFQGNIKADSGFRKRNMAALLYKYFVDMQATFTQVKDALEPGGRYIVVIGNSATSIGEDVYEIRTDDWLTEIAITQGFRHCESLPMTDQAGYMRHSKNMVKSETIIVLQKP